MRNLGFEVDLVELNHQLITTTQLRHTLTQRQIRYRVAIGELHPVVSGVYSRQPGPHDFVTQATAFCLAVPTSFLSGAAAARYWELRRGVEQLEFTVPVGLRPRSHLGAVVHESGVIDDRDVFPAIAGLRVASPERSVFELAGRLDLAGLRSVVHSGLARNLLTPESLGTTGTRLCGRGRDGTRLFRSVMSVAGEPFVHSEPELRLIEALRPHESSLGAVVAQHPIRVPNGYTIHVDVGIPRTQVGVEVDGPTHDVPIAAHRDRSRDLHAAAVGWQILRVSADDIVDNLRVVVAYVLEVCRHRARLTASRS
jgi:very-short-patch-repair endonuclease